MGTEMHSPFEPGPIDEIPLARAPLVRVLSQVRWPTLTQMQAELFAAVAAEFGRAISVDYPIYGEQQEVQIVLTPNGPTQQAAGIIYQFQSSDENWRVSLSTTFITLEVSRYTSIEDFRDRLASILRSLQNVVSIPQASRIGFRYVNRVDEPDTYARIGELVNPLVMGGGSVPLVSGAALMQSVSESLFIVGENRLLARWAHLPPRGTTDPTIDASDMPSWLLDLDTFKEGHSDFTPESLAAQSEELSRVGYKFFRWAVKSEFLKVYGGDIDESTSGV
jgi:uncharacterized protein (TIGR04255 family)